MKVIGKFVLISGLFVIIIASTTGCTKNKSADNNGINSNNNVAQVKPKNSNPPKLDFTLNDIDEVKIEHTDTSVKTLVLRIIKGDEVSKFLSLLQTAKAHNEKLVVNNSSKIDYSIDIIYKHRKQLKLEYYKNMNKITIDNIDDWYYDTNEALRKYILK